MKILTLGFLLLALACTAIAQDSPQDPRHANPMLVDQVRVGMLGYGVSVFHGDDIEPFPVKVVSIISNSSAKRATIWLECTGPRMQQSGPVQGMSGSPIYLWPKGEQGTMGEGGRLIGAFAFGYSDVNVCLVGVQPIEYMRQVGQNAVNENLDEQVDLGGGDALASLQTMQGIATSQGLNASGRFRLDAITTLMQRSTYPSGKHAVAPANFKTSVATPSGYSGSAQPMMLPLSVGSDEAATLVGPLLSPLGLQAMAGGMNQFGGVSGKAPDNVEPSKVKLEPGSVLSIPLAFGDMDLNASGTVTDVRPDGTVLAFGHAMQSFGSNRLPMATGYTHFVVSRNSISFKQANSLDIVGTIVRDEASAVAGVSDIAFHTAPVTVHVDMPDQPACDYKYEVVHSPSLTPAILGAVVVQSITAVQAPPVKQTTHMTGQLRFTGGRVIDIDTLAPGNWSMALGFDLMGPVTSLMVNPFEALQLESADLKLVFKKGVEDAQIEEASLDHPIAQPGQTLKILVQLKPFEKPAYKRTLEFKLPEDLIEGEYQISIEDAMAYTSRMLNSRADLLTIEDIDGLTEAMKTMVGVKKDAIYVGLPRLMPTLSIEGQNMEGIPSSRAALFGATSNSGQMPLQSYVEESYPAKMAVSGSLILPLIVQYDAP